MPRLQSQQKHNTLIAKSRLLMRELKRPTEKAWVLRGKTAPNEDVGARLSFQVARMQRVQRVRKEQERRR